MSTNKFTPSTIEFKFSIPLYQRLFEWEEEQVKQLLKDLYASFKKDPKTSYYIGALTVFHDKNLGRFSLVDGQQRFTVLTLIGVVLGWEKFLKEGSELRLSFFARKKDQEYIINKINKKVNENNNEEKEKKIINVKMESAISVIDKFFKDEIKESHSNEFKTFMYEKTTFFLAQLPESYSVQDLNRYFEAMNEAGKGLENHEILKVRLLKEIEVHEIVNFTKIWNLVSDMDKCLIIQKADENYNSYNQRFNSTISKNTSEIIAQFHAECDAVNNESLKDIAPDPKQPEVKHRERSEKAILSFADFLLHVLWITVDDINIPITDFFKRDKLLSTFDNYLLKDATSKTKITPFFENLLKYRLLFDHFIIRINSSEGVTNNYNLNFNQNDDTTNDIFEVKRRLIQYQSMLYVSTSAYLWIPFVLKQLFLVYEKVNFESLLKMLMDWDNERHKLSKLVLEYGSIDRYWFWRLDYYLWERREELFQDKFKVIANQYIFRSNRSIEHVSPQNPKSESKINLNELLLHCFGNLAMISSGQNSSLQNESYEVKMAHVTSFINGSIGGSIESLKLLKIKEYETWNEHNIIKHHNQMIDVLKDSFIDASIKDKLESLKIDINAI